MADAKQLLFRLTRKDFILRLRRNNMAARMLTVWYECDQCNGTGVYSGMCEGKGRAVVCLGCYGSGRAGFKYKPFTGRKRARGIKFVSLSGGYSIIQQSGLTGKHWASYSDFLKGKLKYEVGD